MADYRLSGHTTEVSIYVPDGDSLGRTFSRSTTAPLNTTQWNLVRTGGANTPTITSNSLIVSVYRDDSAPSLYSGRVFLQFPIPSNISRLDSPPQLFLNCTGIQGNATVVPTSIAAGGISVPWDTSITTRVV